MKLLASRPFRLVLFVGVLALAVGAILSVRLLPTTGGLRDGQVASQDIKAPARLTFTSDLQTRLRREQAVEGVATVLTFDPNVARRQLEAFSGYATTAQATLETPILTNADRLGRLRGGNSLGLGETTLAMLSNLSPQDWRTVADQVRASLSASLSERIPPDRLVGARALARDRIDPRLSPVVVAVAADIVSVLVAPTVAIDQTETDRQRRSASDGVDPVRVTLEQGEMIVRDGEVLTPVAMEKLRGAGLLETDFSWPQAAGLFLVALAGSMLLAAYVWQFEPSIFDNPRRLLLLAALLIATVLAARLILPGRDIWAVVFPFAAVPMVIAALLDARLGMLATAILAVWTAQATGATLTMPELQLSAMYFLAGVTGILVMRRADRLWRYFIGGAAVAAVTFVVVLGFYLVEPTVGLDRLGFYALAAIINGFLTAVLTIGVFILLGLLFGITTSWHLMELSQPDQPLLRRLLTEAPGTYHHSIIVANLAERAAEAIGADALLVRVGAYYHDVGKMLRPGFFVENQIDGQSPHDALTPEQSARIIRSHVTDGMELARQHRVPARVRAFIPEHHGTRMAMYFYAMATKLDPDVPEEWFSYPGPIPQSRETALVMMADGVEAAVRANRDHSAEGIETVVDQIIAERLREGQLDESGLTLGDLRQVKGAFMSTLRGVYHPRIEYPAPVASGSRLGLRRRKADPQSIEGQTTPLPPTELPAN